MDIEKVNDAGAQLELPDLQSNEAMHDTFQENSLLNFYSRQEKYPVLLNNARVCICQFASIYCCKQAFLIMKIYKSRLRTRLTDGCLDAVMRISPFKSNFSTLAQ